MPPINPANAIAAYSNTARAAVPTTELKPQTGQTFADLVQSAGEEAIKASQVGEKVSVQALSGKADLADVVTAVSNAEITLQTVVAVRDRVVSAYLDILKMPI
jgi:flagellar hook-basal body complex protein FliE